MNTILRSFLVAMANAAIDWLIQLDESDAVITFLHDKLDQLIEDTNDGTQAPPVPREFVERNW